MSNTHEVGVVLDGLGEGSLGLVSVALREAVFVEAGEVMTVRATVRAPGPAAAVSQLVDAVTRAAPGAVPLRVDQDLVAVSDIARRLGRSREPVQLLVDGKRGPGRFPPATEAVGDGIRVWPSSVVLEWSGNFLGLDLAQNGVPPVTAAVLDVSFATRRSPGLVSALGRGWVMG
jgi:hypothetical protein